MNPRHPREIAPHFPREWVEFFDPDDSDHLIAADLTWLCSSWSCGFGTPACVGVTRDTAWAGCCAHGAYLCDEDDRQRLDDAVSLLDDDDWQWRSYGCDAHGYLECDTDEEGNRQFHTRLIHGACIFANQPDFPAGGGCALHIKALQLGRDPWTMKPDVCWQLPLYRSQEYVTRPDGKEILKTTITEFDRSCWGPGGDDMDWYCTGDPHMHHGRVPVWQSLAGELRELIGAHAYEYLAGACARYHNAHRIAPHPATICAHNTTDGSLEESD